MTHRRCRQAGDSAAYYLAGASVCAMTLGVRTELISMEDETVTWMEPLVVLEKWGDFLDLLHREVAIKYGGCLAEALCNELSDTGMDAANATAHAEARETAGEMLDSWREDHADVVAYVEEWLQLRWAYDWAATSLIQNMGSVVRLADGLCYSRVLDSGNVARLMGKVHPKCWRSNAR